LTKTATTTTKGQIVTKTKVDTVIITQQTDERMKKARKAKNICNLRRKVIMRKTKQCCTV
jgi:hypothetical protein